MRKSETGHSRRFDRLAITSDLPLPDGLVVVATLGSAEIAQPQAGVRAIGHYLPRFQARGRLARGELVTVGTCERSGLALRLWQHHPAL
jgi:hypothetical protein